MKHLGAFAAVVVLVACSSPQPRPASPPPPAPPPPVELAVVDASVDSPDVPAIPVDVPAPSTASPHERLVRAVASGTVAPTDALDPSHGFRSLLFTAFPARGAATNSFTWGVCRAVSDDNATRLRTELGEVVTAIDGGQSFACTGDECVVRRAGTDAGWYLQFAAGDGGSLRLLAMASSTGVGRGAAWVTAVRSRVQAAVRSRPCPH